jgi:hypothetical protein
MRTLSAVLAFALAMFIFSTMVSVLVETLVHRLANFRQRGFRHMIERIFDEELWTRYGAGLAHAVDQATARRRFADAIVCNEGALEPYAWAGPLRPVLRPLARFLVHPQVTARSTLEFAELVADTDVGRALIADARGSLEARVHHLTYTYERYGRGASEYFRQRAQMLSLLVAVVFAFAANIHAGRLLDRFQRDPALVEELLARSEGLLEAPATAAPPATDEERERTLAQARAQLAELEHLGLPIGHGWFPWCPATEAGPNDPLDAVIDLGDALRIRPASADPECDAFLRARAGALRACVAGRADGVADCLAREAGAWDAVVSGPRGLEWLLMVLLTGGLIGLGSPFWFSVFSNLARLLGVHGTARTLRPREDAAAVERAAAAGRLDAFAPATPVGVFRVAAELTGREAVARAHRPPGTPEERDDR